MSISTTCTIYSIFELTQKWFGKLIYYCHIEYTPLAIIKIAWSSVWCKCIKHIKNKKWQPSTDTDVGITNEQFNQQFLNEPCSSKNGWNLFILLLWQRRWSVPVFKKKIYGFGQLQVLFFPDYKGGLRKGWFSPDL